MLKVLPTALIWQYHRSIVESDNYWRFIQALHSLMENIPFLAKRVILSYDILSDNKIDLLSELRMDPETDVISLAFDDQTKKSDKFLSTIKSIQSDYPEIEQFLIIHAQEFDLDYREYFPEKYIVVIDDEDTISDKTDCCDHAYTVEFVMQHPDDWWRDKTPE